MSEQRSLPQATGLVLPLTTRKVQSKLFKHACITVAFEDVCRRLVFDLC